MWMEKYNKSGFADNKVALILNCVKSTVRVEAGHKSNVLILESITKELSPANVCAVATFND